MKKELLLLLIVMSALSAFSQTARQQKPTGLLNTKKLADIKFTDESKSILREHRANSNLFPLNKEAKTSTITWQKISASMNIYGSLISFCKPLQWNDELNAVSFIHRKSPTYSVFPVPAANAESGAITAMVSLDCGTHWDSTALYVNDNFWGHHPGGAIYNPIGNTSISSAYIVGAGPTSGAGLQLWTGNWYASKKLGATNYNNIPSTVANAQQVIPTTPPFLPNIPARHDFAAYGFTATDDGKVRVLSLVRNDSTASDTAVMLMTGTFNNTNMVFDWSGNVFDPPTTIASDGTENWTSHPIMAWNEQGTVGYIVVMGSRSGNTGSNIGLQPIVYKTINSGSTWTLENGIDFNQAAYDGLKAKLWPINNNPNLVIPNFFWKEGFDATVDVNDKLHIFSSLVGHCSDHPDSIYFLNEWSGEKYIWPHTQGQSPCLYDFVYNGAGSSPAWSYMLIDSMSSEGPGTRMSDPGYPDNPWNADTAATQEKVGINARLQLSRTPDGKYLLYTWSESDTAFTDGQKKWNNLPNVKARLVDLKFGTQMAINKIDITSHTQSDVANSATCYFISPKFKIRAISATHISISVPITVSNSHPYSQSGTNTHWYSCAGLEFSKNILDPWNPNDTLGVFENNSVCVNSISIYPNPGSNKISVRTNTCQNNEIKLEILNSTGQVIEIADSQLMKRTGEVEIDVSNFVRGIYFVRVKTGRVTSAKKLIIE